MNTQPHHIYPVGDSAITIELEKIIDEDINRQILSLFNCLQQNNIFGVIDIIPAYSSITLVYDVASIKNKINSSAYHCMHQQIISVINDCDINQKQTSRLIEVPVCYDISLGIDLEEMSTQKNISIEEIIRIHTSKTYRVYMIGFLPGFAYMGKVDETIVTPRKQQPRTNIVAGSIGIAGEQTGIYPLNSPGGWNIIGQTPIKMFDAERETPIYLQAGDEVKFIAISLHEFNDLKSKTHEH
jgi:inhibitor of KinA